MLVRADSAPNSRRHPRSSPRSSRKHESIEDADAPRRRRRDRQPRVLREVSSTRSKKNSTPPSAASSATCPVAIEHSLADPTTPPGRTALLAALAAFDGLKQACVVVDAGTAITVDFVDGAGVFHGGVIAPGLQMMLDALAQRRRRTPGALHAEVPSRRDRAIRQDHPRRHARRRPRRGARARPHSCSTSYSESYGAYPVVIATGGDAENLFRDDEVVETIVPHLVLRGIAVSVKRALQNDDDD